ncbi:MAG: hypothetical protein R6V03_07925 [Kiritimatiellia bacterium]
MFFFRLYEYFGIIGILSIPAWIGAVYMIVRFAHSGLDRTRRYWTALVVVLLGAVLARVNSANVSAIRLDQSADLELAGERGEQYRAWLKKQKELEETGGAVTADADDIAAASRARVTSGEEDEDEEYTTGKEKTVALTNLDQRAESPGVPAYRLRGKQERETGKKRGDKALNKAAEAEEKGKSTAKTLPSKMFYEANRYDKFNLLFSNIAFWIVVLGIASDYLSRFNKTFDFYFPIPLGGRLLDSCCPGASTVKVDKATPDAVGGYLRSAVLKGETFLYFGPGDLWKEKAIQRVPLVRKTGPWPMTVVWPLKKIVCNSGNNPFPESFDAFECLWFRRYCMAVTDPALAADWLASLADFLDDRRLTLATARYTVNVVWNFETPPPSKALERLMYLCGETQFRIVVIGNSGLSAEAESGFEQTRDEMPVYDPPSLAGIRNALVSGSKRLRTIRDR